MWLVGAEPRFLHVWIPFPWNPQIGSRGLWLDSCLHILEVWQAVFRDTVAGEQRRESTFHCVHTDIFRS